MGVNGEARGRSLTGVFDVVLWGYDRDQVARCIGDLEEQLTLLYADQRRAAELGTALERARTEIMGLRARLSGVPAVHQIGAEVETILAAAERQALEIRASADGVLSTAREEATQVLASAKQQAARSQRDADLLIQQERRRHQEAANEMLAAARQEAERIVSAADPANEPAATGRHALQNPPGNGRRSRSAAYDGASQPQGLPPDTEPYPTQSLGEEPV
ncbi:MAG: hypothetical protein WCA46_08490 [Actinocatenispora sp.]